MDAHPQFDAMTTAQEQVAIEFCKEVYERGSLDAVRLLEMAEALYWAEIDPSKSDEVVRILEAARKMAHRTNMRFVLDPAKVVDFLKHRKEPR